MYLSNDNTSVSKPAPGASGTCDLYNFQVSLPAQTDRKILICHEEVEMHQPTECPQ